MEYIIPYSPINNKNKNIQRVIHTKKPTKIKGYRKIKNNNIQNKKKIKNLKKK